MVLEITKMCDDYLIEDKECNIHYFYNINSYAIHDDSINYYFSVIMPEITNRIDMYDNPEQFLIDNNDEIAKNIKNITDKCDYIPELLIRSEEQPIYDYVISDYEMRYSFSENEYVKICDEGCFIYVNDLITVYFRLKNIGRHTITILPINEHNIYNLKDKLKFIGVLKYVNPHIVRDYVNKYLIEFVGLLKVNKTKRCQ